MTTSFERVALICCLAAFSVVRPAHATGVFSSVGPDTASVGLAGAGVAGPGNAASTHLNPAGLADSKSGDGFIGVHLSVPMLGVQFDDESRGGAAVRRVPPYAGVAVGTALTPPRGFLHRRLYLGVVGFLPAVGLTHLRVPDVATPYFYRYDAAPDTYQAAGSVALSPVSWLSFGIGARLGVRAGGRFAFAIDPAAGDVPMRTMDGTGHPVFAPIVGARVGPQGAYGFRLSAAAVWRGAVQTDLSVPVVVDLQGFDLHAFAPVATTGNVDPATGVVGVALEVQPCVWFDLPQSGLTLRLLVDAAYRRFSEVPSPLLGIDMDIHGADVDAVGLRGALDMRSLDPSPGFEDTLEPRAGVEVDILNALLTFRGGLAYRPTPIPDQTGVTNFIDASTVIGAAGATLRARLPVLWDAPVRIGASWQGHFLLPRQTVKSAANDGVGGYTASGAVHMMRVDVGFETD